MEHNSYMFEDNKVRPSVQNTLLLHRSNNAVLHPHILEFICPIISNIVISS